MLSENSVVVGWSWTPGRASLACERTEPWRELDRQLQAIARKRAALDAEELGLIREAVRVQLWRPLGMASMREYLESRMGYGPQVAAERLRVAEALDALPAIEEALVAGDLSYSAVRELTRIATRKTDGAWAKAARGKNVRQIEELVAEREPGDPPESQPKPQVRRQPFRADLRPDVAALLRQARQVIEAERGEHLDNDELIEALCGLALEASQPAGKTPRPRHQVMVTVCRVCEQGWQSGAGREIPIAAVDVEMALCDAQHVDERGHVTNAIPAATRRFVWRRDHGRCVVPGCRAARCIDAHHLRARAQGGGHEPENIALLCAGHHRALHAGLLVIRGVAPSFEVIRVADVALVKPPEAPVAHVEDGDEEVPHVGDREVDAQVELALVTMGCTRREARTALERARARVGRGLELEAMLRAALREYARPTS